MGKNRDTALHKTTVLFKDLSLFLFFYTTSRNACTYAQGLLLAMLENHVFLGIKQTFLMPGRLLACRSTSILHIL